MLDNAWALKHTNPAKIFIQKYLNVVIIFFPVTSFLLIPAVQGTTIITVFISLLFCLMVLMQLGAGKLLLLKELYQFFVVIFVLSFFSQLINLVSEVKLTNDLTLINAKEYLNSFYRISHITQTLYLVSSFLLYIIIKYFSDGSIVKYIFWALRLLCFYALYEFVFYLLTGQSGDFVTNRTFGYNKSASLFQTTNIGGLSILRIKGYTGEPSMFTFTVIPYWILAIALKRQFDVILMFVCLVLTTSTTAYASMLLFFGFWFFYKKQYKLIVYFGFAAVAIAFVLQLEAFRSILDGLYDFVFGNKLDSNSSDQRGGAFENHIDYWKNLNGWGKLFGIGFGYIRSTDFFSTLLLNTGFIGVILFTYFVFKNWKLSIKQKDLNICYKAGLILTFLIMMATVPEFSYPSLWIYLALGNVFHNISGLTTNNFDAKEKYIQEHAGALQPDYL